ncbi:MAG: hypothetical protein AAF438_20280 [Pseudomonadota bacterium]
MSSLLLIVGGISILGIAGLFLVSSPPRLWLSTFLVPLSAVLLGIGWGLWRLKRWAVYWAAAAFAVQIPFVLINNVSYNFASGLGLYITFSSDMDLRLLFRVGAAFEAILGRNTDAWSFGVNVVAVACFIALVKGIRNPHNNILEQPGDI